ncbi:hypothetical protein FACS1894102_5440 [Spirochaetia bacterium]|nr:hypothetical protein FACS1894102_5440 [Spirochaetia bacterium]
MEKTTRKQSRDFNEKTLFAKAISVKASLVAMLLLGLVLLGCSTEVDDPTLEGEIYISTSVGGDPVTEAESGDALYAVYTGSEPVTYQWNNGEGAIEGEETTSATYTPTTAGTYTVTVSCSGYASKTSAGVGSNALKGDIYISNNFGGSSAIETEEINRTLYAVYTGDEDVTYQWNKDGSAIPDETDDAYNAKTTGTYTVTVILSGYARKTSDPVSVHE